MMIGQLGWENIDPINLLNIWRLRGHSFSTYALKLLKFDPLPPRMHTYVFTHPSLLRTCVHVHIFIYLYVYYIYTYIYTYMFVRMYVCLHVCVCLYASMHA